MQQVAWLCENEYPHLMDVVSALCKHGFDVHHIDKSADFCRWAVLHPNSKAILRPYIQYDTSVIDAIKQHNIRTLNPMSFVELLSDRSAIFQRIGHSSEIPTPLDFTTTNQQYIIKPRNPQKHSFEISDKPVNNKTYFSQKYIPNNGIDMKVYVIGKKLFCYERPSILQKSNVDKMTDSVAIPTPDIAIKIANAISHITEAKIFGFDLVRNRDSYYLVDVNPFPSMRVVDNIRAMLTEYIVKWLSSEE